MTKPKGQRPKTQVQFQSSKFKDQSSQHNLSPAAQPVSLPPMLPPTFNDVVAARDFLRPYLPKTPLVRIAKLSDELGCDYYAKLENLQPIGAFKVRGGVNLVGHVNVRTACVSGRPNP